MFYSLCRMDTYCRVCRHYDSAFVCAGTDCGHRGCFDYSFMSADCVQKMKEGFYENYCLENAEIFSGNYEGDTQNLIKWCSSV